MSDEIRSASEAKVDSESFAGVTAATVASALLTACGGANGSLPAAFDAPQLAPERRILGATKASKSAMAGPTAQQLLDWAEQAYAELFPGPEVTSTQAPYVYRHYRKTGNYLGVAGNDVYVLGPVSSGQLWRVGTLADFTARVFSTRLAATDVDAVRFLHQAQFGATSEDVTRVREHGFAAWIDQQTTMTPGQSGVDWMFEQGYDKVSTASRFFFEQRLADRTVWNQLFARRDTLRTRIALALSEYFVVSIQSVDQVDTWVVNFGMVAYWDLLCRHAFGNFRELLEAVTLSPVMGAFLSHLNNLKEDPVTGRMPDENFAREVMQLFTIGLVKLNPDGTPALDGQGRPIESYGAADVSGLARVFTGWVIDYRYPPLRTTVLEAFPEGVYTDPRTFLLPMKLVEERHSSSAKIFLGTTIPAGTDGRTSLRIALDTLFRHPNVGPFFARQMIQRLVTSDPSPGYVSRVAAAFNDNGSGVRGDLKAVWRAILLDVEARDPGVADRPGYGKLREPIVRVVQWAHTVAGEKACRWWYLHGTINDASALSQSPFRAPSVFNWFRPGYVPPGTDMARRGATAPEFQIVSETTVAAWVSFMQWIVMYGLARWKSDDVYATGEYVDPEMEAVLPAYTHELPLAHDGAALIARLNLLLAAGRLDDDTVALLVRTVNAMRLDPAAPETRFRRVAAAVFMVLNAPGFLVQK